MAAVLRLRSRWAKIPSFFYAIDYLTAISGCSYICKLIWHSFILPLSELAAQIIC